MSTSETPRSIGRPTVDVVAPGGGRIVLRPVIPIERIPAITPGMLATVVVLCAVFLATSFNPLGHSDLWGHLGFGRWIVQQGALPVFDPFRHAATDAPFLNVPWLGQVLGYLWHESLGAEGLVLAHAMLVTLSAAGLILAVRSRGVSLGAAAAAAVAGYLLALPVVGTIRPQLFGIAAFPLVLWAVTRLPSRRDPLLWLPLVMALWANLHGSFVTGLAVLGCYALATTWDTGRRKSDWMAACRDRSVRRAWLALILGVGATCLNPIGVKLLPAVLGFSGHAALDGISEWRTMTLDSLSGALFVVSLAATCLVLYWSPRRVWTFEILLLLVFGLASLTAIRMLAWWAIAWPWVIAPHAAAAWVLVRPARVEDPDEHAAPVPMRTFVAVVIVVLALLWSPPIFGLAGGKPRGAESVMAKETPHRLAEEIAGRNLTGRFCSPMDWADYLTWRTHGALEPMVYSHVHLVDGPTWQDFHRIRRLDAGWQQVADRHGIRYLVLRADDGIPPKEVLAAGPRYQLIYRDDQAALIEILPASE